jgi:hypothetical protein
MFMRSKLMIAAVLVVAAGLSVVAFLSMRGADSAGLQTETLLDYQRPLVEAGVPTALLPKFGPITTTSVVSESQKLGFDQWIPALQTRRRIRIAVYKDQQLDLQGVRRIETTQGYDLYLLRHETRGLQRGFHVVLAYFLPYEGTPAEVLASLGVERRKALLTPDVLPVSFVAAPPSLLGVVVSTVTATDTGGSGPTTPGSGAGVPLGGADPGATIPDPVNYPPAAPEGTPVASDPWFESPEGRQWIQEMNEYIRQQQGANHPDAELARAEDMARDVEQALERNRQQALNRAGQVLTGLQAANELLRQFLDGRDIDEALRRARDCHNNPTNPLARRAQSEDRENYDRALEQINDAQADNDGDMWVRRLNTANNAVGGVAIPGTAGLGFGALGTVTVNAGEALRSLQIERTRNAVNGVTPCDPPPPCPEPAPEPAPAPSTQNHTPGLSRVAPTPPAPGPVCRPAQASIVVDARESDGRTITFRSIVNLTNSDATFGRDFRGTGTGPYREQFVSDQCPFTVTWTGDVGVAVEARVEEREVNVAIAGPVTQAGDWPGESCLGGTYYAPYATNRPVSRLEYSCRFDNVDFARGGIYRSPPPEESPNPYGCTLNIGPLISAPGTSPR